MIVSLPLGFGSKVGRAKEHFHALKVSIDAFTVGGEGYAIIKEADRKAGKYSFRVKVLRDPPIVDWSLLIGDCIHNARSALDHLFWDLIIRKHPGGNVKNAHRANFPILRDKGTFNGRKDELQDWVSSEAFALLERMQPFNHTKGAAHSALMVLHDLDIFDKHKLLLPTVDIVKAGVLQTQTVNDKNVKFDGHANLLEFDDNGVLAQFTFRTPDDVLDANYGVAFDVIFDGQFRPREVVPTLKSLIEVVESVGKDFLPLL